MRMREERKWGSSVEGRRGRGTTTWGNIGIVGRGEITGSVRMRVRGGAEEGMMMMMMMMVVVREERMMMRRRGRGRG